MRVGSRLLVPRRVEIPGLFHALAGCGAEVEVGPRPAGCGAEVEVGPRPAHAGCHHSSVPFCTSGSASLSHHPIMEEL